MFVDLPVLPPLVEGLPAPVAKKYRAHAKDLDNLKISGASHAIKHHEIQGRPVDPSWLADAAESNGQLIELRFTSKTLGEEINTFTVGPYRNAVKELWEAEIDKKPIILQAVFDGFTANDWLDAPGMRGSFDRSWAYRHKTVRDHNEKVEHLRNMMDSCDQTARQNKEVIARIDAKLARQKGNALAL